MIDSPLAFLGIVLGIGLAPSIVVALLERRRVRAAGFSPGGRRFPTYADFLDYVEKETGLKGRPRKPAWHGAADKVRFDGDIAHGRRGSISYGREDVVLRDREGRGWAHGTVRVTRFAVSIDPKIHFDLDRETADHHLGTWYGLIAPHLKSAGRGHQYVGLTREVKHLFVNRNAVRLKACEGWLTLVIEGSVDPEHYSALLRALDRTASTFDRVPIRVRVFDAELKGFAGDGGGVRCPYCHDAITGDEEALAACRACDTVLHAACWEELGRCPLLGCESKEARRPKVR